MIEEFVKDAVESYTIALIWIGAIFGGVLVFFVAKGFDDDKED